MTGHKRILLAGLLVAGACVLGTGAAFAQYTGNTLTLKDSSGNKTTSFSAGETGNATATALETDTDYELDFAQSPGTVIGTGTSDENGDIQIAFRIPTTASLGTATLSLQEEGSDTVFASATIQVVSAQAGASPTPTPITATATPAVLPTTGARILGYTEWGVTLLLLGSVLALGVRVLQTGRRQL